MLISVCFPLRIVATVEPNWLENVIDRVEYVVDSWSSTCDVDYFIFFFVWDYVCGQGLSANLESESHKAAVVVFSLLFDSPHACILIQYGVSYISRTRMYTCVH